MYMYDEGCSEMTVGQWERALDRVIVRGVHSRADRVGLDLVL